MDIQRKIEQLPPVPVEKNKDLSVQIKEIRSILDEI